VTRAIARLWRGEVPLAKAFWNYAIAGGLALNAATTFATFLLLTVDSAAAVAVFLLPVPYYLFMLGAVWRSAERYTGPPARAKAARVAIVVWTLIVCVT
jgi:hypothetical protein